jgi:hypothetical protein
MKKTVIKRRKRVPAAGGVSAGRMTDQAAAEALVAVGRLGVGGIGGEDSDGEVAEQPRKKKAKKGKSEREKRKDRDEDDVVMEGTEEEGEGAKERPQQHRRRSRESNGSTTWDLAGLQQPENGHGSGMNGSPPLDRQQRAPSVSRLQGGEYAHLQRSSSHGQFMGSPHPHGGFDLPPLNAALGGTAGSYGGYGTGIMGGSREYVSGAPSSYIRSGSSAPSRTHSPLGPAGAAAAGTGYVLPPPHGMASHGLVHQYFGHPTGMSPLHSHSHSPPPHLPHEAINGTGLSSSSGVPTISELKHHYDELHEQRKKLEEMMEKNDRMMAGVKRGLDEMRGVHQPSQSHQSQSGGGGGTALPLMKDSDRPRSRASVWPLDSTSRD